MYDMYPNYAETMTERGAGGLGHYDYPVYERPVESSPDAVQSPEESAAPNPRVSRGAGYVSVNEMIER